MEGAERGRGNSTPVSSCHVSVAWLLLSVEAYREKED